MSNFVQVRLSTSSSSAGSINHDFRNSKISYLRNTEIHNKWENNYMGFEQKEVKQIVRDSISEYKELYRKRVGRKFRTDQNSDFLSGVITLSPKINSLIKDGSVTKQDLDLLFFESLDNVIQEMEKVNPNIKLFYSVIHYDEKTPHMHFATSNHLENGTSFFQKFKRNEIIEETNIKENRLSKLQDVCAKPFNQIGFRRGIKKSKSKHMSVRRMHEEEIKILKSEKEQLKEQLNAIQKALREHRDLLKENKRVIKASELQKEEKKAALDNLDTQLRQTRESLKTVQDKKNDIIYSIKNALDEKSLSEIERFIKENSDVSDVSTKISTNLNL